LQPQPQDEQTATYCQLLQKSDSDLDPTHRSAVEAERKVRAHLGFPKTKAQVLGHSIIITKAHIADHQKTPLDILCQDGAFLSIDELIGPSGKTMTAQSFLNGYAAA
jgi:methionyl-tRNA formyltransferase